MIQYYSARVKHRHTSNESGLQDYIKATVEAISKQLEYVTMECNNIVLNFKWLYFSSLVL